MPNPTTKLFTSSSEKNAESTLHSSEGPTLPIIGGASEHSPGAAKKATAGRTSSSTHGEPEAKRKLRNGAPTAAKHAEKVSNPDLEVLRSPWALLPADTRRKLEARLGEKFWGEACVSVVFTRNQNVRAGINRLKTYLGAYHNSASKIERPEALGRKDVLVAVVAQGEATVKLVGILEMVKRVVKPIDNEGKDRETWYMYTALSSQMVKKGAPKKPAKALEEGDAERMDIDDDETFEPVGSVKETPEKSKKLPVLTVWLSKEKVPEFKDAFGEQEFQALKI